MKNILMLTLLALVSFACQKKKDTLVEITVKNANNTVVSNATVKLLTAPPYEASKTPVLEKEGKTDINGVIRFNFNDTYQLGQAGVAVLNIEVEKGNLDGRGVIKIESETTSTKIVVIN